MWKNYETFPKCLRPISRLSTKGMLFEKVFLKIVKRHTEEKDILNRSKFDLHARHNKFNV
jgi:hypothetical protein